MRYGKAVSNNLIEIYTYIFKNVFNFRTQLSELINVLKTYRLCWAKLISDDCFHGIRNAVSENFNSFDMDKGISDQICDKVLKNYRKRNFQEEEIEKYLKVYKKK